MNKEAYIKGFKVISDDRFLEVEFNMDNGHLSILQDKGDGKQCIELCMTDAIHLMKLLNNCIA